MEATKRPWVVIDELKQVNAIGIYDSHVKILICELRDPENKKDEERMQVNASLIVRAVNTFAQAREALKRAQRALLLCEKCIPEKHYMNHGCYTQEHARMSIQEIGDVLTAMEATHEL